MNRGVMRSIEMAASILLGVSAVLAQAPGLGRGMPIYNPTTEITAKGSVEEVQTVQQTGRWGGVHLSLKTDTGNIEVHLGPSSFISRKQFSFNKGDQIEVLGSKVKIGEKDVLIAREVTKENKTLVLRNSQGIPEWSGGRRVN